MRLSTTFFWHDFFRHDFQFLLQWLHAPVRAISKSREFVYYSCSRCDLRCFWSLIKSLIHRVSILRIREKTLSQILCSYWSPSLNLKVSLLRQDQNSDCNFAMTWAAEEKKRRGRPKTTWRRTVEKEGQKRDSARRTNWRPRSGTYVNFVLVSCREYWSGSN